MSETLWKALAWVVSREPVANYLIKRAQRTPYFHLEGYMNRWWLFNPYGNDQSKPDGDRHKAKYSWLPSIRVHHILREDFARDMHDHPWDARTIILMGEYDEVRLVDHDGGLEYNSLMYMTEGLDEEYYTRKAGDTATLKHGEYHNITRVSPGGVMTLFFTWKYVGTWGFWKDGKKIPHKEYINGGKA